MGQRITGRTEEDCILKLGGVTLADCSKRTADLLESMP